MFGGSKLCSLNLRITSLEEEVSFNWKKMELVFSKGNLWEIVKGLQAKEN
jgi:hypothetical protein